MPGKATPATAVSSARVAAPRSIGNRLAFCPITPGSQAAVSWMIRFLYPICPRSMLTVARGLPCRRTGCGPDARAPSSFHQPHQRQRIAVGIAEFAKLQVMCFVALDGLCGAQERNAFGLQFLAERIHVGRVEVNHRTADWIVRSCVFADHQPKTLQLEEQNVAGLKHERQAERI